MLKDFMIAGQLKMKKGLIETIVNIILIMAIVFLAFDAGMSYVNHRQNNQHRQNHERKIMVHHA